MSVQDETWDRPFCAICNREIPHGQKGMHGYGRCGDQMPNRTYNPTRVSDSSKTGFRCKHCGKPLEDSFDGHGRGICVPEVPRHAIPVPAASPNEGCQQNDPKVLPCPCCGCKRPQLVVTQRDAQNRPSSFRVLCPECGTGSPSSRTWNTRETKFDAFKIKQLDLIAAAVSKAGLKPLDKDLATVVIELIDAVS